MQDPRTPIRGLHPSGGTAGQIPAINAAGTAFEMVTVGNVPPGGASGQILVKLSDTDYDSGWQNVASGPSGSGLFRGEWAAASTVTTWSDDFSDGTVAPFTVSGSPANFGAQVVAYAALAGTNIAGPPAKMLRIDYGATVGSTTFVNLDLSAQPIGGATKVRFWWGQDASSGGTTQFLDNGTSLETISAAGWVQTEHDIAAGDQLAWEHGATSSPWPYGYLARVETLAIQSSPYMTGDFVVYEGALWKSAIDNNTDTPGATANWARVPIGYDLAATTASRPTGAPAGAHIFDTTLGKPVWFNGTGWVDATGASV